MITQKEICFATNNPNKLAEIQALVPDHLKILSLGDIGCNADIPETAPTLEGNALLKASYIWERYKIDCFADDTGLEVPSLNNAPGVYSARYAGPQKSSADNMQKLLRALAAHQNRDAQFRTVICLIIGGSAHYFEGTVRGHISTELRGTAGFGYDPVFIPQGSSLSFAEMTPQQKNQISHRGQAVKALVDFLKE